MINGSSNFSSYFSADTSVLAQIGDLVSEAGKTAGFNSEEIGAIQLAVDEACTNTICHGLKHDASKKFQLIVNWRHGEIEILILETGEPFDPSQITPPNLSSNLDDRSIGGLGFFFIQKLMDEADFYIGKEGKKFFRMKKIKKK